MLISNNALKTIINGLKNHKSDWNATEEEIGYIKNKPFSKKLESKTAIIKYTFVDFSEDYLLPVFSSRSSYSEIFPVVEQNYDLLINGINYNLPEINGEIKHQDFLIFNQFFIPNIQDNFYFNGQKLYDPKIERLNVNNETNEIFIEYSFSDIYLPGQEEFTFFINDVEMNCYAEINDYNSVIFTEKNSGEVIAAYEIETENLYFAPIKSNIPTSYEIQFSAIVSKIKQLDPLYVSYKMDMQNPTGTGSFSLNRKPFSPIGSNSHAEGFSTTASGDDSHAEGLSTTASGDESHAEGFSTTASGDDSHAEGDQTIASGYASHAEGRFSIADGSYSHAEGISTKANGDDSHAEGDGTEANGDDSHAEGYLTKANGLQSHAEGSQTEASGDDSHAEGYLTKANGLQSHAEGSQTEASGDYSHAEGARTSAIGNYSHAEGLKTTAYGKYCHAEGCNNLYEKSFRKEFFQVSTLNTEQIPIMEVESINTYNIKLKFIKNKRADLLQKNDIFVLNRTSDNIYDYYYQVIGIQSNIIGGSRYYTISCYKIGFFYESYIHVTGSETSPLTSQPLSNIENIPSSDIRGRNIYTLTQDGIGWYENDLKIGGTSFEDPNASSVMLKSDFNSLTHFYLYDSINNKKHMIKIENGQLICKPAYDLNDFEYEIINDSYQISGWKQTFNGITSTELYIPDNLNIVI